MHKNEIPEFSNSDFDEFINNIKWVKNEKQILELMRNESSIVAISLACFCSTSTVNKRIKNIKKKIIKYYLNK